MKTIYIAGFGTGDSQAPTLCALNKLKRACRVYGRTEKHPGLTGAAYGEMARFLLAKAQSCGEVVFAVTENPVFWEKTVKLILKWSKAAGVDCRILPSVSFTDKTRRDLAPGASDNFPVTDAGEGRRPVWPDKHIFIMQPYDRQEVSRLKPELSLLYPEHHPVAVIRFDLRRKRKRVVTLPLSRIDSLPFTGRLTVFCLPPCVRYSLEDMLRVMRRLRAKDGCPWDIRQDHFSLRPYLLEEAYEVIGAIDGGDKEALCEELGDLLLQVIFHSQVAAENGDFTFYDLTSRITEKLIRRHPHVFGSVKANTAADVQRNWEKIKKSEKKEKQSLFTLELYLPALLRAQKLQRQASGVGFDWPDASGAWDKVEEELKELKDAYFSREEAKIKEEMGDLLFSLVNVARFLNVDAEQALAASTKKFYGRLLYVEKKSQEQGGEIAEYDLTKLDEWWEEAKNQGHG